ncbi:hypothetical protein JCM1841_002974 [Sporobolomyces salmonicolor]
MVQAPEVLWAQRSSADDASRNLIMLTINVPELDPDYTLSIDGNKLSFSGKTHQLASQGTAAQLEAKTYAFELELFDEVEEARRALSGKSLYVVLRKKTPKDEYWPRLTKDKVRLNWLKTDFSKWKDEDEQEDEEPEADDGGMGGGMGGMPPMGMGGAGGPGGFDMSSMMGGGAGGGMDFASMLQDLEAMMAQMKASGAGLGGEAEGGEDSSDDEGPPPLEEA